LFKRKCLALYEISKTDRAHFNEVFHCNLPEQLVPQRAHRILKVLQRCQLPHEMFFTLHETAQVATQELSAFTNKKRNSVDADILVPYLVLVTITAFHELCSPQAQTAQKKATEIDLGKEGFLVRMLAMEHFTLHRVSMAIEDYSYVTFKEVEQQILQASISTDHVVLAAQPSQAAGNTIQSAPEQEQA